MRLYIQNKKSKPAAAPPLLGAHFSIAKGLHNALLEAAAYDCNALQLFTKNASTWKERTLSGDEIKQFEAARATTGIHCIASHASYLINLAGPDKKKQEMSVGALSGELIRSSQLRIPYVVLHPGSHMGAGEQAGIARVADGVNRIFSDTSGIAARLLFETTAGQGASVGHRFEQLAQLLHKVENKKGIGICLDTSHIFAAGYDLRTQRMYRQTMAVFDAVVGRRHLYVIHLNDSKKGLGSKIDRHEHIGRGEIGMPAFGFVMNDAALADVPKIIETPKAAQGKDWDAANLKCLRGLVKGARLRA
ncbi:MAG: deoxyribonuclease IV [Desulfobacterales bacterium]|nr:deoxyribonuclease IV [Desulfobacterales bacterium]